MLAPDAGADALAQASELLWQAWRFVRTGARLYVVSGDAADWVKRLRDAALVDEDGKALDGAIATVATL